MSQNFQDGGPEEDPFGAPPPNPPDDGGREALTDMPNRVQSESQFRSDGNAPNDSGLDMQQEDSVYARAGENPLEANHHAHRTGDADDGDGFGSGGQGDDPFSQSQEPPPGLRGLGGSANEGRNRTGSVQGSRSLPRKSTLSKGGANQPNLHEVMFENKAGKKKSLASSMVSNNRRPTNGGAQKGDPEDPFANFGGSTDPGALGRSNSLVGSGSNGRSQSFSKEHSASFGRHASISQAPQIVTTGGGGGHQDPRSISPGTGISSEDRHNAENPEELFMPNMKREQFIPVRVARDKIKNVLSEMASMKTMHLAALDTMEKQHAFLKAQLESATATYVKKLTGDYNNRVTALESEYKRRLENLNSNAMHDVDAGVDEAKKKVERLEEKMMKKVKDREAELEHEQKIFQERMAKEKEQREEERREMKDNEAKNEEMILKVKELEMKLARAQQKESSHSPTPAADDGSKEKISDLEDQVTGLESQLNTAANQRRALEQQAIENEEEMLTLKLAASKVEKLEQENADLRAKLGGSPPPV